MRQRPPFEYASSLTFGFLFLAALALGAASACGSEAGDDAGSSGTSGTSGGSSGSSGGLGTSGGTSGGPEGDGGRSGGDGGTCARGTGQTALQPLDMFIVMDRSISMRYDTGGTLLSVANADCDTTQSPPKDSRWCKSVVALSSYLGSAGAAGNRAALQFFGASNACDGTAFGQSVQPGGTTGYTDLPTNQFNDDLNAADPDQFTPLEGAVRGIIAFTGRAANRTANRKTIGVLITDADTGTLACSNNVNAMRDLLQAHFTATGVPTFVIGMTGADFGVVETLATGGNGNLHPDAVGSVADACGNGAGPCRSWNVGNGDGNVLAEAMKIIQQSAVGCTLRMPKPETGTLDLNQVQVEYSPGGNPPSRTLARATNAAACAGEGFYYDDNTNPSNIILCPDSCKTVSGDPLAKIEIIAACVQGGTPSSSGGVILK